MNPFYSKIWKLLSDYYKEEDEGRSLGLIDKMSDKDLLDIVDTTKEFKKGIVDLTDEELGVYFDEDDANTIAREYLKYAGPRDTQDAIPVSHEVRLRLKSLAQDQGMGYGAYDKADDFVSKWFDLEDPSMADYAEWAMIAEHQAKEQEKSKPTKYPASYSKGHSRRGGGGGALPPDLIGSLKTLPRGLVRKDDKKY